MRLAWRIVWAMIVLMVLVVAVPMLMLHGFMNVFMLVSLGQMQPEASPHESASGEQLQRQRLPQQADRQHSADKRR
jgi:hypothetical protein